MQLIPIEDLEKLASNGVNEASIIDIFGSKEDQLADGVSFKFLEDEWNKTGKGIQALKYKKFRDNVLRKLIPPIELVGTGSSRESYACIGGKCLKVAMNEAGIQQNKQEYAVTKKKHFWSKSWPCFSQSYSISKDGSLLVAECCSLAKDLDRLVKDLDVGTWEAWNVMLNMVYKTVSEGKKDIVDGAIEDLTSKIGTLQTKRRKIDSKYSEKERYDDGYAFSQEKYVEYAIAALKRFKAIKARKAETAGQKIVASLLSFWDKNGVDVLLPTDCGSSDNWGYAIRYGKVAPVILDAGFSKDIAKKYYSYWGR